MNEPKPACGNTIAHAVSEEKIASNLKAIPKTMADLLIEMKENPTNAFPMLRATCSRIADYLDAAPENILIDSIEERRDGFRAHLESRKYAKNSIRSYVNYLRIVLNFAQDLGWEPRRNNIPDAWLVVVHMAADKRCKDVAAALAHTKATPAQVTLGDVESWVNTQAFEGRAYDYANRKKMSFLRVLRECGIAIQTPTSFLREKKYREPMENFPPVLRSDVESLLQWKTAEFAVNRPKGGRHRKVSSKLLREEIRGLFGFAKMRPAEWNITRLSELVRSEIVGAYVAFRINERKANGYSLQCSLRLLSAALRQYPSYSSIDFSWFKPLIDSIPVRPKSEIKQRKASKCVEYGAIESIPPKIHATRAAAAKQGDAQLARVVMNELLMRLIMTLGWRQRNIRECRINGDEPNLVKAQIPSFSDIDKPDWVKEEERRNPAATFWQFHFSPAETKTKIDVRAVLPRTLVPILEEYLRDHRQHLVRVNDPGTLFVNENENAMAAQQVVRAISTLTLRHAGKRVTPHLFRDIIAFTWLKAHPADYLTLARILWHSNVNTTVGIYGSRFNESSGVCAMETWLEGRENDRK